MKKFIKENWFKLSILFLLVIIVISAAYYFFILAPNKEQEQQQAILEKEQQQQAALQATKDYNKTQLDSCIKNAERSNVEQAMIDCQVDTKSLYNYCMNSGAYFSDSQCKSMAGMNSDGTITYPNCRISPSDANNLKEALKNAKDDCFKEFPQN